MSEALETASSTVGTGACTESRIASVQHTWLQQTRLTREKKKDKGTYSKKEQNYTHRLRDDIEQTGAPFPLVQVALPDEIFLGMARHLCGSPGLYEVS